MQAYYQVQLSQFWDTKVVPALGTLNMNKMYVGGNSLNPLLYLQVCLPVSLGVRNY